MASSMKEEEKKPKPRGGARPGAGRKNKAESEHRITFIASQDVWEILQTEVKETETRTQYIEDAIRLRYKNDHSFQSPFYHFKNGDDDERW